MTLRTRLRPNPYVGPRAFQLARALRPRPRGDGAPRPADRRAHRAALLALGRRQDLADPGGAGSRAGARGLPRAAGDARQPGAAPGAGLAVPIANRYVLSLLLSLEEALPAEQQMPLAELAGDGAGRVPGSTAAGPRTPGRRRC